jgi:hypothetical protein
MHAAICSMNMPSDWLFLHMELRSVQILPASIYLKKGDFLSRSCSINEVHCNKSFVVGRPMTYVM